MGENLLAALGVTPDNIWGDDNETLVYTQVIGDNKTRIFRFYSDPSDPSQHRSLASRVVNYYHGNYHGNKDEEEPAGFADRGALRDVIWSSIASVWPECANACQAAEYGKVVDIGFNDRGEATWHITMSLCLATISNSCVVCISAT